MLLMAGCAPWEDAVSTYNSLVHPTSAPEATAEPTPSPEPTPDDRKPLDSLGTVLTGSFAAWPERSIAGWLLEYFPNGEWACTETAVDYWADALYEGDAEQAHFAFRTDAASGTWTLEACEIAGDSYAEDELAELLEKLG